jgi:hypothetical protein
LLNVTSVAAAKPLSLRLHKSRPDRVMFSALTLGVEPGPDAANCTRGLGSRLRTRGRNSVLETRLYPFGVKSRASNIAQ